MVVFIYLLIQGLYYIIYMVQIYVDISGDMADIGRKKSHAKISMMKETNQNIEHIMQKKSLLYWAGHAYKIYCVSCCVSQR